MEPASRNYGLFKQVQLFLCIFLLLLTQVSCKGFFGKKSEGMENPFLYFLGLIQGKSIPSQTPEYRLNGFLRDLNNQPLRRHGLEKSGVIHLTNQSGMFSLYLNSGRHTIQVSNPDGVNLGSFSFTLESVDTFPVVEYSSPDVPFQVVWEDLILLPQNTLDLTAGEARIVINELAPGIPSSQGGDMVELFVISGGNLLSASICVRNVCSDLPEIRLRSGDFIILREGDGVNDSIKEDGPSQVAWDFYGLPSMTTTDSVVYLRKRGIPYASVLNYANNNGVWNGCNGTSGNVACIPPIINAGQWSMEGENWEESDAVLKDPPGNFGQNDTILRCPVGTTTTGKPAYIFSSNPADRSFGGPNTACPQFSFLSAIADSPTTLTATFSQVPNSNANIVSNYKIYEGSDCQGNELSIQSVSLSSSTVTITTNTQTQGQNYVLCASNITAGIENEPLLGNKAFFSGFAPTAQLTLNEVAPGLPGGTDFVEIFVLDGGTTSGLRLCNRTTCVNFPDRIVQAGEYIVFYAETGANDQTIQDGQNPNFWEFFGAPNMETTDSIVTIRENNNIQSALAYANGDGNWTGGTYISTVVSQGKWPQAGPTWQESDAQTKTPSGNWGTNDTLIKIPNGTGVDNKTVWTVSSNPSDRTIGFANSPPLPPPVLNPGDLVINELRRRSNGHFFEIRNMTAQAIDLNAGNVHFYRAATCQDPLTNTTWTNKIKLTGIIPANGYYFVTSVALGIGENQVVSHSFGDNTCAILTKSSVNPTSLTDPSVLDAVGWGTSVICKGTCASNLANDGVLRRTSAFQSLSGGNNSAEFTFHANCLGTPGQDNSVSSGCLPLGSIPSFSLAAGWHPNPTQTNITTTGADSIRYTIDNTNPNCHSNGITIPGNSGIVDIDQSLTLKAVSCRAGVPSAMAERSFIIGGPPPPSLAGIFFNEFRRKSGNHWFELINTNTYSVDLDAANAHVWRRAGCDSNTFVGTTPLKLTGTIPANGYYLVSVSGSDVDSIADQTTSSTGVAAISDNNCIALTNSSTAPSGPSDPSVQDLVGWGSAQFFKGTVVAASKIPSPPSGESRILQRFPNGNNTNNNNNDFVAITGNCDGTPKAANTSTCPDFTPPEVASVVPANNATGVPITTTIQVTFNEPMLASTITTNTTNSVCSGSIQVSDSSAFSTCVQMASITNSGNTWTLTPNSVLTTNTNYFIRVTTAVQDLAGNNMANTFQSQFQTGSPPTNLLVNGSFESDANSCSNSSTSTNMTVPVTVSGTCPHGWTIWNIDSGTRTFGINLSTPPTAQDGSRVASFNHYTNTLGNRVIASNCFALDPTKNVTITGWGYITNTTNTPSFTFQLNGYDDSLCSSGEFSGSANTAPTLTVNQWTQSTYTRTPTQYGSKSYGRLFIRMRGSATPNLWIDNISVTQP